MKIKHHRLNQHRNNMYSRLPRAKRYFVLFVCVKVMNGPPCEMNTM